MKLYHGSIYSSRSFELMNCAETKDFGLGFYLTDSFICAQKRATGVAEIANQKSCRTVNYKVLSYVISKDTMRKKFKVLEFRKATLGWLDLIVGFRTDEKYEVPYDIIMGPVLEARSGVIIAVECSYQYDCSSGKLGMYVKERKEILKNLIDKKAVGTVGLQYCFKTERALDYLTECSFRRSPVCKI